MFLRHVYHTLQLFSRNFLRDIACIIHITSQLEIHLADSWGDLGHARKRMRNQRLSYLDIRNGCRFLYTNKMNNYGIYTLDLRKVSLGGSWVIPKILTRLPPNQLIWSEAVPTCEWFWTSTTLDNRSRLIYEYFHPSMNLNYFRVSIVRLHWIYKYFVGRPTWITRSNAIDVWNHS